MLLQKYNEIYLLFNILINSEYLFLYINNYYYFIFNIYITYLIFKKINFIINNLNPNSHTDNIIIIYNFNIIKYLLFIRHFFINPLYNKYILFLLSIIINYKLNNIKIILKDIDIIDILLFYYLYFHIFFILIFICLIF